MSLIKSSKRLIKKSLWKLQPNLFHKLVKRISYTLMFFFIALSLVFSVAVNAAVPMTRGITVTTDKGTFTQSSVSVFPGTNLKFYPGFVVASTEEENVADTESRWQKLFSGSRKQTYRPKGIYGGVTRRLDWKKYYTNQYVRPTNPSDHTDPAYNWSLLDAIFNINAIQNEGALVVISVGEVGYGGTPDVPAWLANSPYNGLFNTGKDGGSGAERMTPKYYRDNIVREFVVFNQALHDHLVATGNIDRVMFLTLSEFHVSGSAVLPADYDASAFTHGVGKRSREVAKIWAKSGINIQISSLSSSRREIYWEYMDNPPLGITYPDMKMDGTDINAIEGGDYDGITSYTTRFFDMNGTYQKDVRPISHATEGNGQRDYTYFSTYIPNPWGYSGVTKPQTASHILWVLSGSPRGEKKDSGLGQVGEDPAGIMPIHTIIIDFDRSWQRNSPSVEEWHEAIDIFGPPGTFAFPYLPKGYNP